jgi:hypothetical protein
MRIIVGTSNYGSDVTQDHGRAWGRMVNDIAAKVVEKGYSRQVDVAGGSDMELAWNTPQATRSWVEGYAETSTRYLYNFGDAQACPQSSTTSVARACDHGWTQEDVYFISWFAGPTLSLPQIYNTRGAQARQWQQLSLFAYLKSEGSAMFIAGALTQYQACQQRGCEGTDNTAEAGWTSLRDVLNDDPRTAQMLPWSTDIKWWPR